MVTLPSNIGCLSSGILPNLKKAEEAVQRLLRMSLESSPANYWTRQGYPNKQLSLCSMAFQVGTLATSCF